MTSAAARPTSTIVSASRSRAAVRVSEARPEGIAPSNARRFAATSAGASPTISVTTTRIAPVKSAAGRLKPTSSRRGTPAGANATSAEMAVWATSTPPAAPIAAMTAASMSSCRTIEARPAPIARRIASSRRRARARRSAMIATLTHAISSTAPEATSSAVSRGRRSPKWRSRSDTAPMVHFGSGYASGRSRRSSAATRARSCCAARKSAPGAMRATVPR